MLSKAELQPRPAVAAFGRFSLRENIVYLCFAAVLLFFAVTIGDKGFLTLNNLFNIARTTAMIAVISVAMTFIISSGELDLSVGSTAALAALGSALAMEAGYGFAGGVIVGLLCGVVVGLINGLFVTLVSIPSFLVTLGMMQLVRGIDMRITYTNPVPVRNETFDAVFGPGTIGIVPILFLWAVGVAIIGHIVLRYTPFGRQVLATGGNQVAARYSGISTRRTKIICFLITGVGAALAGMLWTGMMGTARYNFGEGAELAAIAAVILGGTSLFGGKGTILGTFVGALMIGTINNGLIIMGLDVSEQMMVAGAIIVLAVAFGKKPAR
ncbi:MAG: ABC transporter permease [Marinovum algicola]|uniref:ABC transporter permease n=1 Tax=Roseobacteraceae TaxID=2854170 RepID=UPI0032EDF5E1